MGSKIVDMNNDNRLAYGSIVCSSLLLPATLLLGKILEFVIKSANPSHVDVHGGLAYLAIIIYGTMIIFALFVLISISLIISTVRSGQKQLGYLALSILVTEVVLTFVILVVNQATNHL